ncbi:MAG: glycosyltransferase family 2 protein [Ignavibacteria bacterium]|nr:glycosyltransferase family 2 protein [Ignavibacteria bacterium]
MYNVASVVILYNPEISVLDNLNSYLNQVDKLFVVDNSDDINISLIDKIKCLSNVEYIWNKTNLGIAAALNIGIKKASDEGYEYLLTMDQDSEAPPNMVSNLLECFTQDPKIALVSPLLHHPIGRNINYKPTKLCEQVLFVWTSGNLLKLNILKITDGFKEDLFIDYVDHEFCLRLNKMGFKIYTCYKTILKHNLGKINEINLFFRKVYPTNHSALRLYYRTRNRFYVKKVYKNIAPEFFRQTSLDFWMCYIKVILFEKDKLKKLKMILIGYIDFRRNKFGKYKGISQ